MDRRSTNGTTQRPKPSGRRGNARLWLACAAVTAAGLLATFGLAEIALRVVATSSAEQISELLEPPPVRDPERLRLADLLRPDPDPRLAYTLRPGVRGRFQGAPVRINRLGMRGPEPGAKPRGGLRIALLGDSHAFGWGVAWEETFAARLAQRLAAPGRPVEVLNLGVPGYNAVQEVRAFERRVDGLEPDLVVIHYVGNDAELPSFLYAPPDPWALRPLLVVEWLRGRVGALWRNGHRPLLLERAPQAERPGGFRLAGREIPERYRALHGLDNLLDAYRRLADLCRERGLPAVLLLDSNDYRARLAGGPGDVHGPAAAEIARRWRARGGLVVDTQERILDELLARGETSEALWLAPDDPHPNPRRHALIAEVLATELVAAGLDRAAAD